MNENINLCEILKGREGETFYCSLIGENVKFQYIIKPLIRVIRKNKVHLDLCSNGGFCPNGECLLFPSKDQRDWNKWIEKQKSKVPKTWSELCKIDNRQVVREDCIGVDTFQITTYNPPEVIKSAIALLKIYRLIEVGYGGNISPLEFNNCNIMKFIINLDTNNKFTIFNGIAIMNTHIAFHTEEQAEEFLKYEENIQLLKDYFMI